jgi:L-threonylcarbamoyladenylate synthase
MTKKLNEATLAQAIDLLRSGQVIAIPTETVYGLAADAENELAVRKIFATKGRPADHPLIVHLAKDAPLEGWADHVPTAAQQLAKEFWPGPLTMILQRGPKAAPAVTGGLSTIGLRVPSHPIAQQLLKAFGGGLAAPSANRFGRVSPTTADHVQSELGESVPMILDGGQCNVGIESTIVDLSSDEIAILRPGAITAQQIEQVIGMPLATASASAPRVSGSLPSHYAPAAGVEIRDGEAAIARAIELEMLGKKVGVIGPNELLYLIPVESMMSGTVIPLPIDETPEGFARDLYATLRLADANACDIAVVIPPPEEGIGVAIADRLRKSAAPRDGQ